MKIVNHRLVGEDGTNIEFKRSPNQSGEITPEYLVIHYTAGRSAASSINWLLDPLAKASAHLLISRDGSITQLVAFNRKAWHAGVSRWAGRDGLNGFSLGIELDNSGKLERRGGGWSTTWGDAVDACNVIEAAHKNGGSVRGWHAYTGEQLEVLRAVAACLVNRYKLKDVIGHDDIAPSRKSDPGPAFPMHSIRSAVMGRGEEVPEIYRTAAVLNIRSGPGVEHGKLEFGPLPAGTRLEVIAQRGMWRQVDVLDEINGDTHRTGWVHAHYIRG
jgi:N-acetylmuramoyl-L-alanine amidase